jgi:hypothetical protein
MVDPELSPGKAQQLPRISTEEVSRGDSVVLILGTYVRHQKQHSFCDCPGCTTVRKLIERGMDNGWQFPFEE